MKIVHICKKFLNGLAYQENELVELHSKMGNEVFVITSKSDDSFLGYDTSKMGKALFGDSAPTNKYTVISLNISKNLNHRFWKLKKLYKTLKEIDPDLIFFHGQLIRSLNDIVKYKLRAEKKVWLAMDCHSDYNNSAQGFISKNLLHKGLYRFIFNRNIDKIDIVYYIVPNTRTFMKEIYGIKDSKMKFLPLGGDLDKMDLSKKAQVRKSIREEFGIPEKSIVIVSGGKLDQDKKTHNLAQAVNLLKEQGIEVHLIILGFVYENYKEKLYQSIASNPNIHLTDWVESSKVYEYFFASDIACFPGGSSVLWMQAICCGLPLVVKSWGDMSFLNVKDNAILMPDIEPHYIKNVLKDLILNPTLLQQMQENAIKEGRDFFSYQRIAKSIIDDIK